SALPSASGGRPLVLVGNLRSEILVVQSAQNRHRQRETDSLDGTRDRRVVEVCDDVVGHDAGLGRRRLVDPGHDLDQAGLHGDLDAEPAELAPGLHLHVAEALGIHVARMRIEPGQHAVDRRFDELAVIGFFHVVGAHALEYVAEQAELAIGVGGGRLCARPIEQDARLGCDQRHGYAGRRAEENQGSFAHDHPRTFWPSFAPHHGPGSTGTPSLGNSTYSTGWLAPPALATADWAPPPITATGSPVTTNCPKSKDIRSIPASKTGYPPPRSGGRVQRRRILRI